MLAPKPVADPSRRDAPSGRWALPTMVLSLLMVGCRAGGVTDRAPRTAAATTPATQPHEASVRPGVNEEYATQGVDVWVERFEAESREIFRERERIVAAVGAKPGMAVADIGAGTGFFTALLAESVGATGTVYAVDITAGFLELIRQRAAQQGLTNIRTVLCKDDSVELPANSIDLAFICDTYHHFEYPHSTMRSLYEALRPGGEVVVVDFKRTPGVSRAWVIDHVRAGQEMTVAEIRACGFEWLADASAAPFLQENYLLRFRKPRHR